MSIKKAVDDLGKTAAAYMEATFMSCDDILIEILLRVPAKSLMRLKCVCKHWLNLISSPSFVKYHASRDTFLVSGFYFYMGNCGLRKLSLKPHQSLPTLSFLYRAHGTYNFYMLDSCNGLVLCSHGIGNLLLYSVSNPTTQKYNVFLLPPAKNGSIRLSCLAFDPARSIHYKVLIIRHDDTGLYEIDMYLSEDKSWKRVYAKGEPCWVEDHNVFWDGAVHWLNKADSTHLQFDVDTEKLIETLLPSKAFDHFRFRYLGECGGDMILVEGYFDYRSGYRIHEMRLGTRHWNVKQWVHIKTIEHLPRHDTFMQVLSVMKRSRLSDMELVLADYKKVYSYNTKLKEMEVLYDYFPSSSPGKRLCPSSPAYYFIERLYPV